MIKAVIIDDELSAISTLKLMLERYVPEVTVVFETNDPADAIKKIPALNPELIFLDIQMPVFTGFELLKQFQKINFSVIFTTAHDKYAIEAIRFSALDYLLKPIDAEELKNAIERYFEKKRSPIEESKLYNNFLDNISGQNKNFKLAINTTEGLFFYKTEEIIRIAGENNYSRFYFSNNKQLLTSKTLKEYEEILSQHGFIRVHKSDLINKMHAVSITADGVITMNDKSTVEISRRRKEHVINSLKNK